MNKNGFKKYKAIVIGGSSGGLKVIQKILSALPDRFIPVIVVLHLSPHSDNYWIQAMNKTCKFKVKEVDEKEAILPNTVYVAPANYHLLIEEDHTFSLSNDEKVNHAKPSIDVLFETAASVFKDSLVGLILTGANDDGAEGCKVIKDHGGMLIVQDPLSSESPYMPMAAIRKATPDHTLPLEKIIDLLQTIPHAQNV